MSFKIYNTFIRLFDREIILRSITTIRRERIITSAVRRLNLIDS
jgi:hypothetical protein